MLAQLSDPHIRSDEHRDAADAAFARAVAAVAAWNPDAVIVTGDLANGGVDDEYERVKAMLAPLAMPVHVLPGNHDVGEPFEAAFGPAEYAVDVGELRLVTVDTHIPGEDGGRIDAAALERRLGESAKPTIVAMHHAPIAIGMPAMDTIGIPAADRAALARALEAHPHVRRVICGHVHRAIAGAIGGVPVFTCPGTHWQLELDLHATELRTTEREPPGFALHLLRDGDVVSHVLPLAGEAA